MRVLCLHGYHGRAAALRDQLRPWADGLALAQRVDFVCVDAPSIAAGDFGWWHARERGRYDGWARTRDWLLATCAREDPFDGVFGFSQGAALAALAAGMPLSLGFAIVVGGFVSRDVAHAPLYDALAERDLPSLHVIGRTDPIVPASASRALAARFRAPRIVEHDGGHVIAATPAIRRASATFLDEMAGREVSAPARG